MKVNILGVSEDRRLGTEMLKSKLKEFYYSDYNAA